MTNIKKQIIDTGYWILDTGCWMLDADDVAIRRNFSEGGDAGFDSGGVNCE